MDQISLNYKVHFLLAKHTHGHRYIYVYVCVCVVFFVQAGHWYSRRCPLQYHDTARLTIKSDSNNFSGYGSCVGTISFRRHNTARSNFIALENKV